MEYFKILMTLLEGESAVFTVITVRNSSTIVRKQDHEKSL